MTDNYVRIGLSSCGIAAGAEEVFSAFKKQFEQRHLKGELKQTGCAGFCFAEPLVEVNWQGKGPVFYGKVKPQDVELIVESHLEKGFFVPELLYRFHWENLFLSPGQNKEKIVFIKDTSAGISYRKTLERILADSGLDKWQVIEPQDIGVYQRKIAVEIPLYGLIYAGLEEKDLGFVAEAIAKEGKIKSKFLLPYPLQKRIVLRHCGVIDPESWQDYLEVGGYQAFERALKMGPEKVMKEIEISGLRGRGGGGFPTAQKWQIAARAEGDKKYLICNADEGDPGAYMDRSILEGDPHSVIEGMLIAALCVGADEGFFYIRAEYPLAIKRVKKAIEQAYSHGYLGRNIQNSGFSFDLEVRLGAGAFVCGEETALIASLEGKRGTPRPRPPYPSQKGLWQKPTVINNVETLANVAAIVWRGGEWFSSWGTKNSCGTKVFALTGKVRNSGLIEVPMGLSLKDIIFDIGGGTSSGKKVKAVQTGGPSGGVIPADYLDMGIDYETLRQFGSIIGSGGMIVMDEDDCMVDIAKFYLGFCVDESCGKCSPCRIGGWQLYQLLDKITQAKAKLADLDKLRRIAFAMQKASLCGLGQTAPNPVVSTLKYFLPEYQEHIVKKKCPALKCSRLITYAIDPAKCKRCGRCLEVCPAGAIAGDREKGFYIKLDRCLKCGQCFEVCKFEAIERS